jgi:hypothetical protein
MVFMVAWSCLISESKSVLATRREATCCADRTVQAVLPAGRTELVGSHDLGTDVRLVAPGEGVVDPGGAAGTPEPGREHPLVETLPRVAERRLGRLRLTRSEAVEGDGEVVDPCE